MSTKLDEMGDKKYNGMGNRPAAPCLAPLATGVVTLLPALSSYHARAPRPHGESEESRPPPSKSPTKRDGNFCTGFVQRSSDAHTVFAPFHSTGQTLKKKTNRWSWISSLSCKNFRVWRASDEDSMPVTDTHLMALC